MWKPTVQKSYWHPQPTSDELYHHGILGQKWGQQNGPPYPLDAKDHSAAEKKAGYKKSIGGGKTSSVKKKKEESNKNSTTVAKNKNVTEQHDQTEAAYGKLREYNKHADEWNKERNKKFDINKEKKIKDAREQMSNSLREIDNYFDGNTKLQKKLVESATDEESMYGDGAYQYLSNRMNNTFGDWYFSDYKSDRAKKAYNNYQKLMKQYEDTVDKRISEHKPVSLEDMNIRKNAVKQMIKAAMQDMGFDSSLCNDEKMLEKMQYIVFWD